MTKIENELLRNLGTLAAALDSIKTMALMAPDLGVNEGPKEFERIWRRADQALKEVNKKITGR